MSRRDQVLFWVFLLVYFLAAVGIGAVLGVTVAGSGGGPARPVPEGTAGWWEP